MICHAIPKNLTEEIEIVKDMIRFGIGVGIAGMFPSVEEIARQSGQAENGGAHSVWCAEDYYYREGFS